ncbi:MAG TPA: hypothetical protein VEC19_02620 [Usitatibacter sp.]|nr:hypothetical protein [Usitatibacter sp.]
MLRAWAKQADRVEVRALLAFFGIFGTIALAPLAGFGTYMLILTPFSSADDRYHFLGWSIVGTFGLFGIVAAWLRVLVPSRIFAAHPVLFWATVTGLTSGLCIGILFMVPALFGRFNAMAAMAFIPVVIGVFLLGATLGARKGAL